MIPFNVRRLMYVLAVPLLVSSLWIAGGCDLSSCTGGGRQSEANHAPVPASQPAGATAASVSIDNFSFDPPVITIRPGTAVTWVNRDDVPHTVTANDKTFGSPALDTDERYSHTFTTAGTYEYFCAVHPHMTARVVVLNGER
jgi:plastocyanin